MTQDEARAFLTRFGALPESERFPCRHGHTACSTTDCGECLTEAINAACLVWEGDEVKSQ